MRPPLVPTQNADKDLKQQLEAAGFEVQVEADQTEQGAPAHDEQAKRIEALTLERSKTQTRIGTSTTKLGWGEQKRCIDFPISLTHTLTHTLSTPPPPTTP